MFPRRLRDANHDARALVEEQRVVQAASHGIEAMRLIVNYKPDAIVHDLFEAEDNRPLLMEILCNYLGLDEIPIVVWTSYDDSYLASRARCACANAVLSKTRNSLDDVRQALSEALPDLF